MEKSEARFEALVQSFPTLRDRFPESVFLPFDSRRFCALCQGMSGGEKDAALFVLSVYNMTADWAEHGVVRGDENDPLRGRFDVHRALSNWDDGHRRAFLAWAAEPWWC